MEKMNLPVLLLRDMVLLPYNELRLEFDKEMDQTIIDSAMLLHDNYLFLVESINPLEEEPKIDQLARTGVVAKVTHKMELPNGKIRVVLEGVKRAKVIDYLKFSKVDENLEVIITDYERIELEPAIEFGMVHKLKKEIEQYCNILPYASNSILGFIQDTKNLSKMTDLIAPYLQISTNRLHDYLNEISPMERAYFILTDIVQELELFEIEKKIDTKVKQQLDMSQKEFLLREKIKFLKEEIGDTSTKEKELIELTNRVMELKASDEIKERLQAEIKRYESLNQMSPEINIVRTYIDWLLELPWETMTIDNDDLIDVRMKLDATHNGLESVKTRIIEYLAVKQMTASLKSPILCLVGPPGVGKTSLAFSIAHAMHRNFVKMSVGGVRDEAEIIGHRKAYVGANPGRIIRSMKKAGSKNPVFLIDEIDKMNRDYQGDPASVLLEILDPEQNQYFSDNYLEEEFDLSKVMFITTANYIDDIPEALKDRLEIIPLSGYTEYEKVNIVKNHLLPKICKEHGVNVTGIDFKEDAILKVIHSYTKEAGVRELERQVATIIRKIVTMIVEKRMFVNKFIIDTKKVSQFLGKEKFIRGTMHGTSPGVVNGLAYTYCGGDILPIEVTYFKGTGNLVLTGSLGEVMKESAIIALDYIKSNYKYFGIEYDKLIKNDIHIHVPEGAIPKDGPSAGTALTTAIISAFTGKKVPKTIAMTGEITLRGNILPIGGLKEKSIGAHRGGVKTIFIPYENERDLEGIPEEIRKDIRYIMVKNYKELRKLLNDMELEKVEV